MMTKYPTSIAALLSLTTTVACSQAATPAAAPPVVANKGSALFNQTAVPGSYIVKASGDAVIRRVFAQYGVALVRSLGNEQYELRLDQDPGLDVLKSLAAGSGGAVATIQPNLVYRSK